MISRLSPGLQPRGALSGFSNALWYVGFSKKWHVSNSLSATRRGVSTFLLPKLTAQFCGTRMCDGMREVDQRIGHQAHLDFKSLHSLASSGSLQRNSLPSKHTRATNWKASLWVSSDCKQLARWAEYSSFNLILIAKTYYAGNRSDVSWLAGMIRSL